MDMPGQNKNLTFTVRKSPESLMVQGWDTDGAKLGQMIGEPKYIRTTL